MVDDVAGRNDADWSGAAVHQKHELRLVRCDQSTPRADINLEGCFVFDRVGRRVEEVLLRCFMLMCLLSFAARVSFLRPSQVEAGDLVKNAHPRGEGDGPSDRVLFCGWFPDGLSMVVGRTGVKRVPDHVQS